MPDYIAQLRCRLAELGCPRARLNRVVREVADHREDLIQSAANADVSDFSARKMAERQLGDPQMLAENLMTTFRRSNWWGRNYLFTFGFLPLLAFPLLWGLFIFVEFQLAYTIGFGRNAQKLHNISNNPVTFHHWAMVAYGCDYAALGLVALLICWLARRSGVNLFWMTMACLVGATYALFTFTYVQRHNYSIGYSNALHWTRAAVPVCVAFAACLYHWWSIRVARRQTIA